MRDTRASTPETLERGVADRLATNGGTDPRSTPDDIAEPELVLAETLASTDRARARPGLSSWTWTST